jgi:hypothetical protein
MIEDIVMRASAAAIAFVACLGGAVAAWMLKRPGEDATLAAAAVAALCIAGAAASLLRRRIVAGLAVLTAGVGVWAATGGIDHWLEPRAPFAVGAALVVALVALVAASEPASKPGGAPRG